MILKAVFVGLIAAYGRIEQGWLGQQMIAYMVMYTSRPIIRGFKTRYNYWWLT